MLLKKLFFLSLVLFTNVVLAQDFFRDKLDNFLQKEVQEKVYLHFDRPQYAAGDNIWFKAYVTDAATHFPTEISWNLHVELINDKQEILDSLTLFIEDGTANGNFSLTRDLVPGPYQVRAYTNWMRNGSDDFFYKKVFKIVGPSSDEEMEDVQENYIPKERLLVDFLPEGGDMIDGIPTKVAVKASDINGSGMLVYGSIMNDKGVKVTDFDTDDKGYALCFFRPSIEENYLALIKGDTFQLPKVKDAGASIRLTHSLTSDKVHFVVLSKNIDIKDGTLVIHRRGQFLLSQKSLKSNTMAVAINKSSLGSGIIHVTFFDKNNIPLSERLVFPNPPLNEGEMVITPDQEVYGTRSEVTLGLSSKSDTVHSASVTISPLLESSYKEHEENIVNYILLNSDLKGAIQSPGSYFTGTEEAYAALDLLMLTHGWSRFNWESLLEDDFRPKYPPERGLSIRGRALNYYNDKDLKEPTIGLTIPSIGVMNETFKLNEDGTFHIEGLELMDSTILYLQAYREKNEKLKKYESAKIELEYPLRPDVTAIPYVESAINDDFLEKTKKLEQIARLYFLDERFTQLETVEVKARKFKKEEMDKRAYLYSEPSNRLILDSLPNTQGALSVFDLLYQVPGVIVTGAFPNQSVQIRGINTFSSGSGPLYLLDGMPVDAGLVQTIPVDNIEFIDVLKGPETAIFGSRGAGGAVALYTRKGLPSYRAETPTGLLTFIHPGYHKAKQFYSPQYNVEREEHKIPDFRATLHWEPELIFENNRAETTFYSSDQSGNFIIRVEGMFTNGEPFFEESVMRVE